MNEMLVSCVCIFASFQNCQNFPSRRVGVADLVVEDAEEREGVGRKVPGTGNVRRAAALFEGSREGRSSRVP